MAGTQPRENSQFGAPADCHAITERYLNYESDYSYCYYGFVLGDLNCLPCKQEVLALAGIFRDHAVIQLADNVPVWGNAIPGAEIQVTFDGQRVTRLVMRVGVGLLSSIRSLTAALTN